MAPFQPSPPTLKNSSFNTRLRIFAQEIERVLETILPASASRLHEAMRYSVLGGGKRLRAYLVWESSQFFSVAPTQALRAAAAVELIQAYSLVHDDLPCMDNSDLRRGKPSCHIAFEDATAVLVGDALIPLAFQVLSTLEAPAEIRLKLIEELGHVIGCQGLVAGQMMDLGLEGTRATLEDLSIQEYYKTGIFFGFAAESGAILGEASPQQREALRSYGILLGKAFQMMDDWFDGWGTAENLGKPCGQDTLKVTYLNHLGPDNLYTKAKAIVAQAIESLDVFDHKAASLREVAFFILQRD
ncbi:MAG: polyprenyl synthetase family protein [Alphaproteobacteria bacterium]|nr:polyprenyl synthetase family protein [Alphaproteobacteria bacterium]